MISIFSRLLFALSSICSFYVGDGNRFDKPYLVLQTKKEFLKLDLLLDRSKFPSCISSITFPIGDSVNKPDYTNKRHLTKKKNSPRRMSSNAAILVLKYTQHIRTREKKIKEFYHCFLSRVIK